ncbi:MAG TPA: hypothetical protein VF103_10585, partial [Polyangiaceae bacterium]
MTNLEALGKHVASKLETGLESEHDDNALRAKLAERAASGKPKPSWRRTSVLVPGFGLAAAVAVAAAYLVVPRGDQPPLTFTVGTPGRPGTLGESVAAPGAAGT